MREVGDWDCAQECNSSCDALVAPSQWFSGGGETMAARTNCRRGHKTRVFAMLGTLLCNCDCCGTNGCAKPRALMNVDITGEIERCLGPCLTAVNGMLWARWVTWCLRHVPSGRIEEVSKKTKLRSTGSSSREADVHGFKLGSTGRLSPQQSSESRPFATILTGTKS